MKKFDRLPPEQRRQEICTAALRLFREKGFAATTMENIVSEVSLSKGGVYRIYPSTTAILTDLMLQGMHLRNDFYAEAFRSRLAAGLPPDVKFAADTIVESLLQFPEYSAVYVEFLWEKKRRPELERVYEQICETTVQETAALLRHLDPRLWTLAKPETMKLLADAMNAAVLSIHVLGLEETVAAKKQLFSQLLLQLLSYEKGDESDA